MNEKRRVWLTQVALSVLEQWYFDWELFSQYGDAEVRRRALAAKAFGLVWHDRHLARGEDVFHG